MSFECYGNYFYCNDTLSIRITNECLYITVNEESSTANILIDDTKNVKKIARVLKEYLNMRCSNE